MRHPTQTKLAARGLEHPATATATETSAARQVLHVAPPSCPVESSHAGSDNMRTAAKSTEKCCFVEMVSVMSSVD